MKNNNSVNNIATYLRLEITHNRLKSGKHLKESEIAKKFNLSRVPVREAFRILQSEGYLEVIPNRGSFVKAVSPEYVKETALVYLLLAPELLKAAIPNYKDSTIRKAESILDKVEKCKDISEIGYLLLDFARIIFRPSKMNYVLGIIEDLYRTNLRLINDIYELIFPQSYDVTDHRKFLEFCKEKDVQGAITVWCKHIKNVNKIVMDGKLAK